MYRPAFLFCFESPEGNIFGTSGKRLIPIKVVAHPPNSERIKLGTGNREK